MSDSRYKDLSIVFGLGLVVGSLATAFLTPKSGTELREDIRDEAYKIKDKIKNHKKEAEQTIEEKVAEIKQTLDTLLSKSD